MEPLLEAVLEILVQFSAELLTDGGFRRLPHLVRAATVALLSVFAGLALGAVSVALHRTHFISNPDVRLIMFCATPVLSGLLMMGVGRLYVRSGRERSGFEQFAPAFLFSAAFGAVRYFSAE